MKLYSKTVAKFVIYLSNLNFYLLKYIRRLNRERFYFTLFKKFDLSISTQAWKIDMTNSLRKKTNGGPLHHIDLVWRADASLEKRMEATCREQNETLILYVRASS